jgi:hypothetical protein
MNLTGIWVFKDAIAMGSQLLTRSDLTREL